MSNSFFFWSLIRMVRLELKIRLRSCRRLSDRSDPIHRDWEDYKGYMTFINL